MKANANAKWQSDRFLKTINALLQLSHLLKIGRVLLVSIKKNKSEREYFSSMFVAFECEYKIKFAKNPFRSNVALDLAKFCKASVNFTLN